MPSAVSFIGELPVAGGVPLSVAESMAGREGPARARLLHPLLKELLGLGQRRPAAEPGRAGMAGIGCELMGSAGDDDMGPHPCPLPSLRPSAAPFPSRQRADTTLAKLFELLRDSSLEDKGLPASLRPGHKVLSKQQARASHEGDASRRAGASSPWQETFWSRRTRSSLCMRVPSARRPGGHSPPAASVLVLRVVHSAPCLLVPCQKGQLVQGKAYRRVPR